MKSKQGQSFLDMVVQQTGNFEDVINAALLNNVSLSEPLEIETEVKTTIKIFSKRIEPATALNMEDVFVPQQKGIGWMEIGKTFIVS